MAKGAEGCSNSLSNSWSLESKSVALTRALWYQKETCWTDSNTAIKTIKGTEIYLLERYTNLSTSSLLEWGGGYQDVYSLKLRMISLKRGCTWELKVMKCGQ